MLSDLLKEGIVAEIADDLYCGGNSPGELLLNRKKLLQALHNCDLYLSASKTIVNPLELWHSKCQPSPHHPSSLGPEPDTVTRMRSFIGAYKVLSRVIPGCSTLLAKLDDSVPGRESKKTIHWEDDLRAQAAFSTAHIISHPIPSDQLWVVTDGYLRKPGIDATLYVTRNDKLSLAVSFFSAKLRGSPLTWLPCEVEAIAIAFDTKHFSPYLKQSHHNACILTVTDSKPCVQSYEKLCRLVSLSPRVSAFLFTVSRYQASLRHVSGSAILPPALASCTAARVRSRPAKSVPSQDLPKILLSGARQSKTYSVTMDISRSPVALPGWPYSRNIPIYDAHTHICNRERVLRKSSPTLGTLKRT